MAKWTRIPKISNEEKNTSLLIIYQLFNLYRLIGVCFYNLIISRDLPMCIFIPLPAIPNTFAELDLQKLSF